MLRLHRCFPLVQSRLLVVLTPALLLPLFEHRRERSCPPQLGFVDPRPPFRCSPRVTVLDAYSCLRGSVSFAFHRSPSADGGICTNCLMSSRLSLRF